MVLKLSETTDAEKSPSDPISPVERKSGNSYS